MPREKKAAGYGAAGGRRNTQARSAKQVTRRQRREAQPRVAMSLDEAREHQAEIEAMIRDRRADGPAEGAQYSDLTRRALDAPHRYQVEHHNPETGEVRVSEIGVTHEGEVLPKQDLILDDDGRVIFRPKPPPPEFIFNAAMRKKLAAVRGSDDASVCGTARLMLRKGYRIDYVIEKTGADIAMLIDLPIGRDGRIPEDKRDDY